MLVTFFSNFIDACNYIYGDIKMKSLIIILVCLVNFSSINIQEKNDFINSEVEKTEEDAIDLPPIITGSDILVWDYFYEVELVELMKRYYRVFDDIDGDLTYKLSIVKTDIGPSLPRISGDYEVVLSCVDSSGNEAVRTVILRVIDKLSPELKVSDITLNLSSINGKLLSCFYEDVIVELSDNSGTFSISITTKELVEEEGFYGKYEVSVTAFDKSNNLTLKTATIRLIDDVDYQKYIKRNLITTDINTVYNLLDLKRIIEDSLYKEGILYDSVDLISCDYFTNEKIAGSYSAKYRYICDGESYYVSGLITVNEVKENNYYILLVLIVPIFFYICRVNKKKKRLKSIP